MIINKHKGLIYLTIYALIVSATNPFLVKLVDLGNAYLINNHNPVSFCNVLFAGDLIALIVLCFMFRKELNQFEFKKLNKKNWITILFSAFISGSLVPMLYFLGLIFSNIFNVILLSTLQIPLRLFVGWFYFKESPNKALILGALLTLTGVLLTIIIQNIFSFSNQIEPQYFNNSPLYTFLRSRPYLGEVFILSAVIFKTFNIKLEIEGIRTMPIGIYNILSISLGIIYFGFIIILTIGWAHFSEILSPFLWKWMVVYGALIVALGIYFKFTGLKQSNVAEIVISFSTVPLFSIFFTQLILDKSPDQAQWAGIFFVLSGIALAIYGRLTMQGKKTNFETPPAFTGT
ncbi:TPA: DMT family transporter [Legionella pneumophila]|nr:DMT family transporter [Legionella pneumophila]